MRTAIPFPFEKSRRIRLGTQLGLVALFAGMTAACSGIPFREPMFTGSTANQRQIISGQPAPAPAAGVQVASVQANDLPPPPGAPASTYAAAPPPPAPYTPPPAQAAPGMPTPLGQVATAPAPALQTMGAPSTTLNQQAASVGGGSGSHVVQPGDTMWNISQRYHIPVEQLMAANGGTTNIRIGQTLTVPGAGGMAAPQPTSVQVASLDPAAAAAAAAPAITSPPAAPQVAPAAEIIPPPAEPQVALATPEGDPAAAPAPAQAAPAAQSFRWPVRGRVIAGFGRRPDGERNDGINLAVPEGTEVRAAEDGTVIYAGNELKSYGNLVLIRHDNGWVSAYAHNSQLQVNRGDNVTRGQVVALSGMTGGVTTPQVHFELRQDATPVDPLQHLSEG
jgi:murein DD-endopeptidase MepM/ murein hydrolase activator NlpD